MKSYIFIRSQEQQLIEACAYVGSNNISKTALLKGHEWCLRHDYELPDNSDAAVEFKNIRTEFLNIFNHPDSKQLNNQCDSQLQ